jgi:POT family proton-dependent oligopeptide transporter
MDKRAPLQTGETTILGHPRGLAFLFGTEMWERFSYYGMRSLLVLYMVKYLLLPGHSEQVIGLASLKGGLERVFGPLEMQPFASQLYGLYGSLVYLAPVLGGLLADRVLGQRRMVIIGASLMAAGHFMMAFEPLLLFALLTLILGNGAFKPNISTQVGGLYAEGDPRRDRAYSIFYVGINIGAFFAPLVCGTLGERVGWHWGFGAAGVGMLIGLAIYLRGVRDLPPDELTRAHAAGAKRAPATGSGWRAVFVLLILFIPNVLFWAAYEQQGNTITLWADNYTDRTINLLFWRGEIPVTWFQAVNPFMIFAFTPLVVDFWAWQAKRGAEPSSVVKMGIGCLGVMLSYLLMAAAAVQAGEAGKISWLWLLAFFAVVTAGELYLSPIGLSFVSKIAPRNLLSLLMGVWLATSFFGNFLAGVLGSYWSSMDKPAFFLMIAAVAGVAGFAILLLNVPLRRITSARL